MRSFSRSWRAGRGWSPLEAPADFRADLIMAFGAGRRLAEATPLRELQGAHPDAIIASASTAGEIGGEFVGDDSIEALVMGFDRSTVRAVMVTLHEGETSDDVALRLARQIDPAGLVHVLLLSDGIHVNGSALARTLAASLPVHVAVTGGLAGDDDRFERTLVGIGVDVAERRLVAVALYGETLRVGYGSVGGWDPFGPERVITQSRDNVLFSLDGEPALALYKRYLGDASGELPASALRFPLALTRKKGELPVVRTILSVNEDEGSMTFAGDVPEGDVVRLMRANFDRIIDGAQQAGDAARSLQGTDASAAILVSCVGRRLVLKQRTEDELDGVRRALGPAPVMAGFYSYGEISPVATTGKCDLHNQTMTVTTLAEAL